MGKAQVFYTDLMISIGIFGAAVVLFLALSGNLQPEGKVFDVLVADSNSIGASLVSSGEPFDWNYGDVSRIGVTDNYRLNASKARMLMNLSPDTATRLFGTNTNYAVFFKDKRGNIVNFDGCVFSNSGLAVSNISDTLCENFTISPDNHLVSVERLVMYNSEIIKIVVQVWV